MKRPDEGNETKGNHQMTKAEVTEALAQKMQANRIEVRRQIEYIATLPGHTVHDQNVDLLHQVSITWKEGQALREIANELIGLIYADETPTQPPPEMRPS